MSTHQGSLTAFLSAMTPGKKVVIPCESKNHALVTLRRVTAVSRYPDAMRDWRFSGRMVTVVGDIGEAVAAVEIARVV